jgi:hypothetical protein
MTINAESNVTDFTPNKALQLSGTPIIEDLFFIGFTKSKKILVYQDDKNSIEVIFRTLTPMEIRDVYEACGKFNTYSGQSIAEKVETLSRSITTVNDMPLVMNQNDKEIFIRHYGREPTPLDQARYIIIEKLQSIHILDLLFEAYTVFADSIKDQFDEIKKKLKTAQSSNSTL